MKKNAYFLVLLSLMFSCTKQNSQSIQESPAELTPVVSSSSITYDVPKLTDPNASDAIDLGEASSTKKPQKRVYLINSTTAALTISLSDLDNKFAANTRFSKLPSSSCVNGSLKKGASCFLDLALNFVATEDYTNSISVNLISGQSNPEFGKLLISGSKKEDISASLPMASVLKLSSITDSYVLSDIKTSITKRYYISNISTKPVTVPTVVAPAHSSLTNDSCSASTLATLRNCYFELTYSYDSVMTSYNEAVSFVGNGSIDASNAAINIAVSNVSSGSQNAPDAQLVQVSPIVNISAPTASTRFYIKNTGTVSIDSAMTIPSPFKLKSTNCEATLAAGKTCFYDLIIDPTKTSNLLGASVVVSVNGFTGIIVAGNTGSGSGLNCTPPNVEVNGSCGSASAGTVACTLADAISNGVVLTNSNSSVVGNVVAGNKSACVLSSNACNSNYSLAAGSKSCEAIVAACTPADAQSNGVVLTNSNSSIIGSVIAGDKSACLLAANACNSNYTLAIGSKSCSAEIVSCTLSDAQSNGWNITNAETAGGNKVAGSLSSCVVSTCAEETSVNSTTKSCQEVVAYSTPGFMQVVDKNQRFETINYECKVTIGGQALSIRNNYMGNADYGSPITEPAMCNLNLFTDPSTFLVHFGDGATGLEVCMFSGGMSNYVAMSTENYNNQLGGDCSNLLSPSIFSTIQTDSSVSVDYFRFQSPTSLVAAGNSVYYMDTNSDQYNSVSKVKISNSDLNNANYKKTPTILNATVSSLIAIETKVILVGYDNIKILNSSNDSITEIPFSCSPECNFSGKAVKLDDGYVYITMSSNANQLYQYVYRTNDGVSFSKIYEGQLAQGVFSLGGKIKSFNGKIYYITHTYDLKKLDPVAQTITDMGIKATYVHVVNNVLYAISGISPLGIKSISSTGIITDISVAEVGTQGFVRVSLGNSILYLQNIGNTTANNKLFTLTGTNTLNLIKTGWGSEGSCQSYYFSGSLVNPLSNDLIYSCQTYSTGTIRKISSTGVDSLLLNGFQIASPHIEHNYDVTTLLNPIIKSGKFYSLMYQYQGYGYRMVAFDSNNTITDLHQGYAHSEIGPGSNMILFKGNIFFPGNMTDDVENIPTNGYELYKYYTP